MRSKAPRFWRVRCFQYALYFILVEPRSGVLLLNFSYDLNAREIPLGWILDLKLNPGEALTN